ncbi:valacyclovir hydrolase [Acyrthosiphon pisum]|uniref:AB hydrolase-1 domain-containing protein n=1 Tax=Acyrthosiphon pisum TaxID=7029 RepID=A0A8R2JQT1_ACYPI|nr:valacyclovir hydrolase [Acyrthosiphon pisum]XP_029344469.1 valacyclovir hydrolase [Acyrthosiphon pisum]XP_029344470.1 valacyclovir hydrolase [Acyrthosiphon pisum]|eukprot:XP_003240134.1 PREDICTED: valacyclovir hydrolase [Acyrthosiphon pisum]
MDQRPTVSTDLNSTKIKVKGFEVNYIKVGNGPQKLLIFPGVLGQISDFRPLTENLDGDKYTIYVWEPPGYGRSRPPGKDLSPGFLYRDADCAITLMEALGIDRCSMLGWCNGGCTAMIAASRAADRVDKLVVWNCNAYVTARDLEFYETIRDVRDWPEGRRVPQFETYGEEYVSDTWHGWIDAFRKILDEHGGDVCRGALAKINAPTLIVHGAKDEFVPVEHGVYLHENIKRSTLEIFPDGKHVLHFMSTHKFVSIVDNFLSSSA